MCVCVCACVANKKAEKTHGHKNTWGNTLGSAWEYALENTYLQKCLSMYVYIYIYIYI